MFVTAKGRAYMQQITTKPATSSVMDMDTPLRVLKPVVKATTQAHKEAIIKKANRMQQSGLWTMKEATRFVIEHNC